VLAHAGSDGRGSSADAISGRRELGPTVRVLGGRERRAGPECPRTQRDTDFVTGIARAVQRLCTVAKGRAPSKV
jgi:hypothetical protein